MAERINGDERFPLEPPDVEAARAARVLVLDERRRRPNYFDGRFLTAADLTDDQNYVLSRLTDLARTQGQGVSEGLLVRPLEPEEPLSGPGALRVSKGWGLTGAGELVGLPRDLVVDVGALSQIQALNQRFGLADLPGDPQRTLTGLFVLALRPVEYTAGPIASYPTGVTGQRRTEDGSIVEATALTLIPTHAGTHGNGEEQRRAVSREIFLLGESQLTSAGVLPLAMVGLSRGVVQWVDNWLVRRELGAEAGGGLGVFGDSRARRLAHLQHYRVRLLEVLDSRQGRGGQFAAAEEFALLPPVGPLPREAILPPPPSPEGTMGEEAFQQVFFPPEIEAELAIVPDDELVAVIEESLSLPPIDLTLSPRERDAIAVLILLPVPRARLQELLQSLAAPTLSALQQPLRSAAPGQVALRQPEQILQGLGPSLKSWIPGDAAETARGDREAQGALVGLWRRELERQPLLWFARRRLFSDRQNLVRLTEVVS